MTKPNANKDKAMQVEKKMTNCPNCNKPILNGGVFPSHAKFSMRCPWCHATLEVSIQPRILTELIKTAQKDKELTPLATVDEKNEEQNFQKPFEKAKTYRLVGHVFPEEN